MSGSTHNPPSSSMAEPAPDGVRRIRNNVDQAVDQTFPASDPSSLTDPSRSVMAEPRLPRDARPGDIMPRYRTDTHRAPARPRVDLLSYVSPWLLFGAAVQLGWLLMRRRR
jgi:hypothetical protein